MLHFLARIKMIMTGADLGFDTNVITAAKISEGRVGNIDFSSMQLFVDPDPIALTTFKQVAHHLKMRRQLFETNLPGNVLLPT